MSTTKTYVTPLQEALAGFPALVPDDHAPEAKPADPPRTLAAIQADMRDAAGDELDRLARQRMTLFPGETYRQAMQHIMAAHPDLKQKYIQGE